MTPFGLFAALGGVTAIAWLKRHHKGMGLSENEFWAAMWLLALGAIAGAKSLFVMLGWRHYASGELRFWADFGTGFVFFGGLAGAALAGAAFARWRRLDFWRGADHFAVALPLGHAIGRVGCYFTGCCAGHPPHPVQLYEATGLALIAVATDRMLAADPRSLRGHGVVFCVYLLLYGMLRLALDPLRSDGAPGQIAGLSYQQVLALFLVAAGGFGLRGWRRERVTDVSTRSDSSRTP